MSINRIGLIKFKGNDVTVVGPDIVVTQIAPDFTAVTQDWSAFNALQETKGKVRIIGSLPSLSTNVCDRETRRFNQEAAALSDQIAILMVSMDLPYTLNNWCAAAGVDRVKTLTDYKNMDFGPKYGVLLKEPQIFRRAIFVVDQDDKVQYAAYMSAIGEEPNYDDVLNAAKLALKS